jgi:bifunctional aspartokinase / homoserine dehydrogenase 1
MTQPIIVMKFGGTSVGDAECIRRTAEIIANAASDGPVVAIVSAMGGVTNSLIAAARRAESGDVTASEDLKRSLHERHHLAVTQLINDTDRRTQLLAELQLLIEDVGNVCRGTAMLRELTPRALDSISSAGEALSSRLLASALCELGCDSFSVQGSELIVTDGEHGNATPLSAQTRQKTRGKILPLLEKGTAVIVSGFMGATEAGLLTTLGRGGSDYSATILGAALDASEIIIWTDVDGVMTADPRLVPEARTLNEISYNEAAALAYFGAKVLHPKTLRPVVDADIPVWIRTSFEPHKRGTKITKRGHPTARGVKAITAIRDVSLITISGRGMFGVPGVAAKTFTAAARARANVLLISQSSSEIDICFIVGSADADRTVQMLRETFAYESDHEQVEQIKVDSEIAIVAVVGEMMRGTPGIAGRTFSCLGDKGINIIAIAQGSSEYNVSFVVEADAMQDAVRAVHEEFELEHPAALLETDQTVISTT